MALVHSDLIDPDSFYSVVRILFQQVVYREIKLEPHIY
jgi:hypothetical protein